MANASDSATTLCIITTTAAQFEAMVSKHRFASSPFMVFPCNENQRIKIRTTVNPNGRKNHKLYTETVMA